MWSLPFFEWDQKISGGERGIRTPGRGVSPYNGLANRRLQPLGHLSALYAGIISECICGKRRMPLPIRRLDRSEAKWRDLRFPTSGAKARQIWGTQKLPPRMNEGSGWTSVQRKALELKWGLQAAENYGAESLGGSPRIYAGEGALQRSGKFESEHDAL